MEWLNERFFKPISPEEFVRRCNESEVTLKHANGEVDKTVIVWAEIQHRDEITLCLAGKVCVRVGFGFLPRFMQGLWVPCSDDSCLCVEEGLSIRFDETGDKAIWDGIEKLKAQLRETVKALNVQLEETVSALDYFTGLF